MPQVVAIALLLCCSFVATATSPPRLLLGPCRHSPHARPPSPCTHSPAQALHEEQDRLAPEWRPILEQLEQRRYYSGQLTANATQAAVRAVLAQLPVAAQWDAASQQLLIGAAVSFPSLAVPAASRGLAAEAEAPRTRRVMLQRQAQDAGAGAAADWAPQLERLFGARLQRTSPETALVVAPAQQLGRVLQWLAQRPAVHWVDPAPKLRLNNAQASSITQVGRAYWSFCCCCRCLRAVAAAAGVAAAAAAIGHCFCALLTVMLSYCSVAAEPLPVAAVQPPASSLHSFIS